MFDIVTLTLVHTLLSVAALFVGVLAIGAFFHEEAPPAWTTWFLVLAVLTSATGFLPSKASRRPGGGRSRADRDRRAFGRAGPVPVRGRLASRLCRRHGGERLVPRLRRCGWHSCTFRRSGLTRRRRRSQPLSSERCGGSFCCGWNRGGAAFPSSPHGDTGPGGAH